MADHSLVETVLNWLGNWDETNAPQPVLIDRDDAESTSFAGRRVSWDLTEDNVLSVASTPERQTEAIGTEYDHRVEDAVSVRIEAAHEDAADFPGDSISAGVSDSAAFQAIVDEAKRTILAERTSYPTVNGVDYHTVLLEGQQNLAAEHKDYYRYDVDVVFRGYETLP
ncbi:MAG: hypothetical protein V5A30_05970 [Haloarculaceae archaeon]